MTEKKPTRWASLAIRLATATMPPGPERPRYRAGKLPPHSHLWCRLHLHHDWHRETTPDGGRFRHCRACGMDDDGTLNQSFDGWYQGNVSPTNEH